jgi:tape measure domain-containing protein
MPLEQLKFGVTLAAQAEQMEVAFGTMLKSAEAGKRMVADLQKFAAETPMTMPGLQAATKTLLQFGVEGREVISTLEMLGNVSGGEEGKLQSMALAFGQMRSTGRLMGQDLLQMINVGFNPLQEIARTTGRSVQELKADMEKGRITVDMVKEALRTATGAGGAFQGMMEKQSKTLNGLMSTMEDDTQGFLRAVGKTAIEAFHLKEAIGLVSQTAQAATKVWEEMDGALKFVITTVATMTAATLVLIKTWKIAAITVGIVVGVLKDVVITFGWLTGATAAYSATLTRQAAVTNVAASANAALLASQRSLLGNVWAGIPAWAKWAAGVTAAYLAVRTLTNLFSGGRTDVLALEGETAAGSALDRKLRDAENMRAGKQLGLRNSIFDEAARFKALSEDVAGFKNEVAGAEKNLEALQKDLERYKTGRIVDKEFDPLADPFGNFARMSETAGGSIRRMFGIDDPIQADLEKKIEDAQALVDLRQSIFNKFSDAAAAAAPEAVEAKLKANLDSWIESLRLETETLEMNAEARKIYNFAKKGMPAEQVAEARGMVGMIADFKNLQKANKEAKKLAEDLEKDAREELVKRAEEGRKVMEDFFTPQEKLAQRTKELDDLLMRNAISWETYERAIRGARLELSKASSEVQRLDAVAAGSADALALMDRQAAMLNPNRGDEVARPAGANPALARGVLGGGGALTENLLTDIRDILRRQEGREPVRVTVAGW